MTEFINWYATGGVLFKVTAALLVILSFLVLLKKLDPRWHVFICRIALIMLPLTLGSHLLVPNWRLPVQGVPDILQPLLKGVSIPSAPTDVVSVNKAPYWIYVVLCIWAIGVILTLGRELIALGYVCSYGNQSAFSTNRLQKLWQKIADDFGVKNATIRVMEDEQSPFITFSSGGAIVVVPKSFESELPEDIDRVQHALRHEAAHLRSADHIWIPMMRIGMSLFWFHPLMWYLGAKHLRACEEASDAEAARIGGLENYRIALAKLALDLVPANQAVAASLIRLPNVLGRLEKLDQTVMLKPPKFWTLLFTSMLFIFAMVGMGTARISDSDSSGEIISASNFSVEVQVVSSVSDSSRLSNDQRAHAKKLLDIMAFDELGIDREELMKLVNKEIDAHYSAGDSALVPDK